jgi:hypothetical protein
MYPAGGSSLHSNREVPSDATISFTTSCRIFWSMKSPDSVRKWPEKRAGSCLWTVKEPARGPTDLWVTSSLTRNLKTDRPSKKLDHKTIGPFKVLRAHGDAYTFDLPTHMAISPTFHASLLRKDPADPLPGQHQELRPPIKVDEQDEYEVFDVLTTRIF